MNFFREGSHIYLVEHILSYLDARSLLAVASSSKYLNSAVVNSSRLQLILRVFYHGLTCAPPKPPNTSDADRVQRIIDTQARWTAFKPKRIDMLPCQGDLNDEPILIANGGFVIAAKGTWPDDRDGQTANRDTDWNPVKSWMVWDMSTTREIGSDKAPSWTVMPTEDVSFTTLAIDPNSNVMAATSVTIIEQPRPAMQYAIHLFRLIQDHGAPPTAHPDAKVPIIRHTVHLDESPSVPGQWGHVYTANVPQTVVEINHGRLLLWTCSSKLPGEACVWDWRTGDLTLKVNVAHKEFLRNGTIFHWPEVCLIDSETIGVAGLRVVANEDTVVKLNEGRGVVDDGVSLIIIRAGAQNLACAGDVTSTMPPSWFHLSPGASILTRIDLPDHVYEYERTMTGVRQPFECDINAKCSNGLWQVIVSADDFHNCPHFGYAVQVRADRIVKEFGHCPAAVASTDTPPFNNMRLETIGRDQWINYTDFEFWPSNVVNGAVSGMRTVMLRLVNDRTRPQVPDPRVFTASYAGANLHRGPLGGASAACKEEELPLKSSVNVSGMTFLHPAKWSRAANTPLNSRRMLPTSDGRLRQPFDRHGSSVLVCLPSLIEGPQAVHADDDHLYIKTWTQDKNDEDNEFMSVVVLSF